MSMGPVGEIKSLRNVTIPTGKLRFTLQPKARFRYASGVIPVILRNRFVK